MGAWSAEIFDDDGADEIREEYKMLLGYEIPLDEAYKLIEEYFYTDYRNQDDEDVYWLAIASFQWENGILMEEVKQTALDCINNPRYLERWRDDGDDLLNERIRILQKLKNDLIRETREKRKRFPKCPRSHRVKTKFKVGDIIVYKIKGNMIEWGELVDQNDKNALLYAQNKIMGKNILLRVVAIDKIPVSSVCPELDYSSFPIVAMYDWLGESEPSEDEIYELSFKQIVSDYWNNSYVDAVCLELMNTKEEKRWGELFLLKEEPNYSIPESININTATYKVVSQFDVSLIYTFAKE